MSAIPPLSGHKQISGKWAKTDVTDPTTTLNVLLTVPGTVHLTGSQLRARKIHLTLCSENVTVEVRNPLTPARGDIEVAYSRLNLRSNIVPVEVRVFVDNVCRRIIAKRFIQTNFLKFVEQRI